MKKNFSNFSLNFSFVEVEAGNNVVVLDMVEV